jgi:hypothetical protein
MSKLIKSIQADVTNNYRVKPSRYITSEINMSPVEYMNGRIAKAKQVDIRVKIGASAWIEDIPTKVPVDTYTEAVYDMKRGIIEEVFGEFRPLIIEMRTALYDEDTGRLRTLLAELEQQMFTVE